MAARPGRCASIPLFVLGVALSVAGTPALAQSPTFEVASVRPSAPDAFGLGGGGPIPGGWRSQNATLLDIIHTVFELPPGFVAGGPSWISRDRFVINARAEGQPPAAQLRAMARALLADRFKLKTHMEPRPVDVYALVRSRSDGRLGPGLRPSAVNCKELLAGRGVRGPVVTEQPPGTRPPCTSNSGMNGGIARLSETWMLEQLVRSLQTWMGRAVIDRTGLEGYYDLDLEFDFASRNTPDAAASAAASVFTAVEEQLGLELDARRETLDVLVVDSAERPMPD